MADFSSIDRTTEDKDIAREGMAATGNPTRGGSPLDILKAKFKGLDQQRTKVFAVAARNGEPFWLELDLDITEDDMTTYEERADRANRAQRRAGQSDISPAVLAGNVISEKNTRMWATNPLDEDVLIQRVRRPHAGVLLGDHVAREHCRGDVGLPGSTLCTVRTVSALLVRGHVVLGDIQVQFQPEGFPVAGSHCKHLRALLVQALELGLENVQGGATTGRVAGRGHTLTGDVLVLSGAVDATEVSHD